MEKILVKGDVYSVATKTECVVTSAGGAELGTATAGNPCTFIATTDSVELSDPDAEFARVNPKYAPTKMRLLGLLGGGINTLPAGYLAAEFLEFGGKDKYVEVTTPLTPAGARVEVKAYERFYRVDVTSDEIGNGSHSNYFFWGVKNSSGPKWYVGCGTYGITSFAADTNWHNMRLVYAADGGCWVDALKVRDCSFNANSKILRNFRLGTTAPTVNELFYPAYTWVKKCTLWVNGTKWRDVHAAIDPSGKPCFYDFVEKEAFYNGTSTALTVGLSIKQARKLGKLPDVGGTLTVSLPSNWQEDDGVVNALAEAESKGWVFTYRTYDADVSVSTFGMRRIWVRKTQNDNGEYVSADGSRWYVEWCVGMIGAEPEAHGYEPYRSVEAAVAYWELEPVVYPEEDLTEE